ncbi:MAG: hypothetical protein HYY94_04375 [Gemmatimonadetes bacterium]|nr:hypothetical protein [Gemmatimonadota bacterium]
MSGLSRSSARPRLGSAVIAAVLYAASAVVVPVVHARTEVLRSTSEVEAELPRLQHVPVPHSPPASARARQFGPGLPDRRTPRDADP